ncbi:hypothetical protein JOC86_004481 [Bacillus pakistanensis]|uniref:Uncharacterized protein n=1 Tax=Rossellomorea pakistanensis TaxID=992288 RepID=A0ABS2NK58_9BACI|nr:hypothetical protein [Bacillus pakistanensis]MBM7587906.1 hypothetical protein [Bacillus pakistanensis]
MTKVNQMIEEWIEENFEGEDVVIEDCHDYPYGKEITDQSNDDYVIVFFDRDKGRINYLFKEQCN